MGGQGLEGFDGGTREDQRVDVAQPREEGAVGVDDGDGALVGRLDDAAAGDLDEDPQRALPAWP